MCSAFGPVWSLGPCSSITDASFSTIFLSQTDKFLYLGFVSPQLSEKFDLYVAETEFITHSVS